MASRSDGKAFEVIDLDEFLQKAWSHGLKDCESLEDMLALLEKKRGPDTVYFHCVPLMYPSSHVRSIEARHLKAHSLYSKCKKAKGRRHCISWLERKIQERCLQQPVVHSASAANLSGEVSRPAAPIEPVDETSTYRSLSPVTSEDLMNIPSEQLVVQVHAASDRLQQVIQNGESYASSPVLNPDNVQSHLETGRFENGLSYLLSAYGDASFVSTHDDDFNDSSSAAAVSQCAKSSRGDDQVPTEPAAISSHGSLSEGNFNVPFGFDIINAVPDDENPDLSMIQIDLELVQIIYVKATYCDSYLSSSCPHTGCLNEECGDSFVSIKSEFSIALRCFLENSFKCDLSVKDSSHHIQAESNTSHPILAHFASHSGLEEYVVLLLSRTNLERLAIVKYCQPRTEGSDGNLPCGHAHEDDVEEQHLEVPFEGCWNDRFERSCVNDECEGCGNCSLRLNRLWSDDFNKLIQPLYPSCGFTFHGHNLNNIYSDKFRGTVMTAAARCYQPGCIKLHLRLASIPGPGKPGDLVIRRSGHFCHDTASGLKFRRPLRKGGELTRKLEVQIQNGKLPNAARLDQLSAADKDALNGGNYNEAPSLTQCQKISSRLQVETRLSSNPIQDLIAEWQGENKCGIAELSVTPLKVYWRIQEHIDALPSARDGVILYFDCTGQVVQDIWGKAVYYYCGVIRPSRSPDNKNPFPVLEFITDSHFSSTISEVLSSFKRGSGPSPGVKTPFPMIVCIDYSWALIHSSVDVFANKKIKDYLNWCFDVEFHGGDGKSRTIVHLCGAHQACTVKKWIGKHRVSKATGALARRSFRALMVATSAEEAKHIFCLMVPVFCPTYKCPDAEAATANLVEFLDRKLNPMQELTDVDEPAVPDNLKPDRDPLKEAKTLYASSPYYKYFQDEYERLYDEEDDLELDGERNPHHYMSFIVYLLKFQLPYICLWSATFVKDHVSKLSGLLTNNAIEGWYHIVKAFILLRKLRLLPADFVRLMCSEVRKRYLTFIFNTEFKKRAKSNTQDASTPSKKMKRQLEVGAPAPVRSKAGSRKRDAEDCGRAKEYWDGKRRPYSKVPTSAVLSENRCVPISNACVEITEVCEVESEVEVSSVEVVTPADASMVVMDHSYSVGVTSSSSQSVCAEAKNVEGEGSVQDVTAPEEASSSTNPVANVEPTFPNDLHASDFRSVTGWLTIEVMDVYFRRIAEKALSDKDVKINCCSMHLSSFLSAVQESNYEDLLGKVLNYCKATAAFSDDLWLWPLYDQSRSHYSFLAVIISHRTVLYMDPKKITDPTMIQNHLFERHTLKGLFRVLSGLHEDMYGYPLDCSSWKLHVPADVPQQIKDLCGLYVCAWGSVICTGSEILVNDTVAENFRGIVLDEVLAPAPPEVNIYDMQEFVTVPVIESVPPVDKNPPKGCKSTSSYLASIVGTLWIANNRTCKVGAPLCKEKGKMVYCTGLDCRDWYHISCVENQSTFKLQGSKPYLCVACRRKIRNEKAGVQKYHLRS